MKINLKQLREKCEKATPGPWHMTENEIIQTNHVTRDVWVIPRNDEDYHYIAAVNPETVKVLIDVIEELKSFIEDFPKFDAATNCFERTKILEYMREKIEVE